MLQKIQKYPRQRWLQEILLFLGFFLLNSLTSWELINARTQWSQEIIYFSLLYGHAQFQRFFVLPGILDTPRKNRFIQLSVVTLLIFSFGLMQVNDWLCTEELKTQTHAGLNYLYNVACATVSLLLFNVPLLVHRFYQQRLQQEQNQMCMQEMELSVLRSQLNPHFMFNTLNNLYGVSLHEPSRTPDLIMQLSQLLRYQVESTRRMWVSLADELDFLESYVALETERVGSRCQVRITGLKTLEPDGYVVAPMLLMPFVENAFKHGTAGINSCEIDVALSMKDEKLHLYVVNTVPSRARAPVSTGVGLDNTRQRLEMIYQGTYQLTIQPSPGRFVVNLILPLRRCRGETGDTPRTDKTDLCLNSDANLPSNDNSQQSSKVGKSDHPAQIHM
jgi:hypothetical protein